MFERFCKYLMQEIKLIDISKLKHTLSYAFFTVLFWQILQKYTALSWEVISFISFILIFVLSVAVELIEKEIFNQSLNRVYEGVIFAFVGFFLGSFIMLQPLVGLFILVALIFQPIGVLLGILGVIVLLVYILIRLL